MSDIGTGSEIVDSKAEAFDALWEQQLAGVIGEWLNAYYPPPDAKKWPFWWAIHINSEAGVLYIYNLALSGEYGYTLYLSSLLNVEEGRKKVINAGGEILERFGLPRAARKMDADIIAALEKGIMGTAKVQLG